MYSKCSKEELIDIINESQTKTIEMYNLCNNEKDDILNILFDLLLENKVKDAINYIYLKSS